MIIDISSLISIISAIVEYMKTISFKLGDYTVSFWSLVVALGSLEAVSFILNMKKSDDD